MRIVEMAWIGFAALTLACEGGPTAPVAEESVVVSPIEGPFASGDVILLDVHLHGCFHNYRFKVSLRVDADSAIVETFEAAGNLADGVQFRAVKALSASQLSGLSQLMEYYRRPGEGRCTSSERGQLRVVRDGETVRREEFNDASCQWFGGEELAFHWFMLADIVRSTDGAT